MENSIPNSQNLLKDCVCPYVHKKMEEECKSVMGCSCNVSLKKVCKDIISNIKWKEAIVIAFVSMILVIILLFFKPLCLECIREFYNSVLPSLLGFSITIYAILFGINDTVRNRLQQKTSDGKITIEILHSTFVFGIIVQGFTLILGMLFNVIVHLFPKGIIGSIYCFLLSFIILWTINTVLHLYCLRTYTYNNNNQKIN